VNAYGPSARCISIRIAVFLTLLTSANLGFLYAEVVPVGDVNPDATNPLLLLGQRLYVGESATGSLLIDASSQIESDGGTIGRFEGSVGQVRITGDGSNWDSTFVLSPTFYVGARGQGELTIDQGGKLESGNGSVASETTGIGTVTIDGANSSWINQGMRVGDRGIGQMAISRGAKAITTGNSRIGNEINSSGTVTIQGADSQWTNSEYLIVGNEGNGSLEILAGAFVSNTSSNIASSDATEGHVLVSGNGSQWQTSDSLRLAGGLGGPNASHATLTINNGGNVQSASFASIGIAPGSTASVVIDGASSRWEHDGELSVGISGTAEMEITNGGTLRSNEGHLGFSINGQADVSVSGEDSRWDNETALWVGSQSPGTLSIQSGGNVATDANYLGSHNHGQVSVTGDSSHLEIREQAIIGGFLGGSGQLHLSEQASTKIGGDVILGYDGGDGEIIVESRAKLELRGVTTIGSGEFSNATLTIRNEGEVDAYDDLILALNAGSTGTLNVETDGVLNMHGSDILVGDGDAHINFLSGTIENTGAFGTHLNHVAGTLAAGNSPGQTHVQGDYTQGTEATLEIELANFSAVDGTPGVDFDFYVVDGEATLMGTIDVLAFGTYSPSIGDTFEVINAETIHALNLGFTGLPGFQYDVISKGNGREALILAFVPEPNSFAFFAAGLSILGCVRRGRHRAAIR
tara:strand:+ start:136789 stop:138867 length:2079 start_codon:yes stop_codon:yes gene_type:complete